MFGDPCQHPRADFITIIERKKNLVDQRVEEPDAIPFVV